MKEYNRGKNYPCDFYNARVEDVKESTDNFIELERCAHVMGS